MTKPNSRLRVYSHALLQHPHARPMRWRIGYRAAPANQPGSIRVSRAVAEQICRDLGQARAEAIAAALASAEFYEDALATVDATLPRLQLDGEHLVADWRHVEGDSDALRSTDPDPDGWYTIGFGLAWRQVIASRCDTVRDDSTWLPPTTAAYQAYVGCFTDPTAALLDLASRAGIAVAYLDRAAIEADTGQALTDDEWGRISNHLGWYDEHVCGAGGGELNAAFLDQVFAAAGVAHHIEDDETGTYNSNTDIDSSGSGDVAGDLVDSPFRQTLPKRDKCLMGFTSWPTPAQTDLTVKVTTDGLPGWYDAIVRLGPAELFHDGWQPMLDPAAMCTLLADLASLGDESTQLAALGWTLRQTADGQVELVEVNLPTEVLDQVDGRFRLPRECGFNVVGELPPLTQIYRSLNLLEAYAYGPTDQLVEAAELLAQACTAAGALGSIFGAVLGLTVDTEADVVCDALVKASDHLGDGGAEVVAKVRPRSDADGAFDVSASIQVIFQRLVGAAAEMVLAYLPRSR